MLSHYPPPPLIHTIPHPTPHDVLLLLPHISSSPTLGDDFLSELGLHTIHCLVGGQSSKLASRPSSCGNVERLHLYPTDQLITGLNVDTVIHQIRIITEVGVHVAVPGRNRTLFHCVFRLHYRV